MVVIYQQNWLMILMQAEQECMAGFMSFEGLAASSHDQNFLKNTICCLIFRPYF